MNTRKKLFIAFLFQIFLLLLIPSKSNVFAEVSTVSTLDEMKPYVKSAIENLQTTYELNYTGNTLITAAQWKNFFSSVGAEVDDYKYLLVKSQGYKQVGTAGNYKIDFTFTYWETTEQVQAVENKVNEVLTALKVDEMDDYAKEKAIHDWIVKNVVYDKTLAKHSAYDAITSGTTVCQGYALLAYKMFKKAGLSTEIVTGTAGGKAHAWNLVLVDGKWYQIDLTWDDPVTNKADDVQYDYYNLTDAQMAVDHKWTKTLYTPATQCFKEALDEKIEADSENSQHLKDLKALLKFEYLEDENICATQQDIQVKAYQGYKDKSNKATFLFTNKGTLATNLKSAIKGLGFVASYSYTTSSYTRTESSKDVIVNLTFTPSTAEIINVTGLTYDDESTEQKTLAITYGQKAVTLKTKIVPENATTKTIIWSSSNTDVATVTNGVVKAIGGGTAMITAKTLDGNKTLTCKVNVTAHPKSIKFDKKTLNMTLGKGDVTLEVTFNPVSVNNKSLAWTSYDPTVATVDSNGKVHAEEAGKTTIKAITRDGKKVATCTVVVYDPSEDIKISASTLNVALGKSATLKATVTPKTAYKVATWTSSNEEVATVNASGVVKAIGLGKCTITATTSDGAHNVTCEVSVIQGVTGITLNKTTASIELGGEDLTLTPTIAPENAAIKTVTWKTSNAKVATVDENGKVHAIKIGTATITCISTQDTKKTAKCVVTVTQKPAEPESNDPGNQEGNQGGQDSQSNPDGQGGN